jgi:hypothetical protein
MNCPICEEEMKIEKILVSHAHQEDEIVDEVWEEMYVCDKDEEYLPITEEE